MDAEREALLWAALLHDIGKFEHRGQYQKKEHEEVGAREAERFAPRNIAQRVTQLIREHHNGKIDDPLLKILQLSDWLAASEREQAEKRESKGGEDESDVQKRMRKYLEASLLENPLSQIKKDGFEGKTVYFRLAELTQEEILNTAREDEIGEMSDYARLWDSFYKEASTLFSEVDVRSRLSFSILYSLMEKYCWAVPSATYKAGKVPDISLFDHCKLVSSFAVCFYDAGLAKDPQRLDELLRIVGGRKNEKAQLAGEEKQAALRLIMGDIGGIQKFITKTSRGTKGGLAAKRVRGRSFLIKLIADAIIDYIMNELSLPEPCLILSAGGKFTIMAPNTERVVKVVEEANKKANASLLKKYSGTLSLNIISLPVKTKDILEFNQTIQKGTELLEKAKASRAKLIFSDQRLLEEIESYGRTYPKCPICSLPMEKMHEEVGGCSNCWQEFELGHSIAQLPSKKPQGYWRVPASLKERSAIIPLEGFDFAVCFEEPAEPQKATLVLVNKNESLLGYGVWKGAGAVVFETVGNYWGEQNGEKMTYEDMGEKNSARYVGWLKIDVDDLGAIFKQSTTLSRYVFLSRILEYFFKAGINQIASRCEDLDGNSAPFAGQIIYAGGDDVLLVGSWDQTISLAKKISDSFQQYSGYSGVSVSAGLSITPTHYPIGKAIEEVEEAIKYAKSYWQQPPNKRSICMLGKVLRFGSREKKISNTLDFVLEKRRELAKFVKMDDEKKRTTFLRNLLEIRSRFAPTDSRRVKKNIFPSHRHVPKICYLISRQFGSKGEGLTQRNEMVSLVLEDQTYNYLDLIINLQLLLLRNVGKMEG